LDTGADETCFPARFATFFGHDNHHPKVIKKHCFGVGGRSVTYIHSVQISLIHPTKSTHQKHVVAWTAKAKKAVFVQKLDCGFGLLGMDIMGKWKSVAFVSDSNGQRIRIVV